MTSCSVPGLLSAVIIRMGTETPARRSDVRVSSPLIPGMRTSSRIRLGIRARIDSIALLPSLTELTVWPAPVRISSTASQIKGSSSTIRIRPAMRSLVAE